MYDFFVDLYEFEFYVPKDRFGGADRTAYPGRDRLPVYRMPRVSSRLLMDLVRREQWWPLLSGAAGQGLLMSSLVLTHGGGACNGKGNPIPCM
jgi:hypothetical protein